MSIIYPLTSGGSGRGMSFYLSYMGCPRRTALDLQYPSEQRVAGATGVGTFFHAFQDIWHNQKVGDPHLSLGDVEFTGLEYDDRALVEGYRLHSWYRDRFPRDAFGTVMFSERRFPGNDEQAQALVKAVMGNLPIGQGSTEEEPKFTTQFDLTTVASEETVRQWADWGWTYEAKPGWYLVDWKSAAAARRTMAEEMEMRLQFMAYQMVFEALFPGTQLQGFWAAVLTKTKDPTFMPVLLQPVTDEQRKVVWYFFESVNAQLTGDRPDEARATECFSWFRACHHLREGRCGMYGDLVQLGGA